MDGEERGCATEHREEGKKDCYLFWGLKKKFPAAGPMAWSTESGVQET